MRLELRHGHNAVAIHRPSAEYAAATTESVCFANFRIKVPVAVSHNRAALYSGLLNSELQPVSILDPSGENTAGLNQLG